VHALRPPRIAFAWDAPAGRQSLRNPRLAHPLQWRRSMEAPRPSTSISLPAVVDPSARLPLPIVLLWLCAFAGLAAYTASWYVPALAQLAR